MAVLTVTRCDECEAAAESHPISLEYPRGWIRVMPFGISGRALDCCSHKCAIKLLQRLGEEEKGAKG